MADAAGLPRLVMVQTSLVGQLAQGRTPTRMSDRPSQHSFRSIVTNKKAIALVALLKACLMMITIVSIPFLKLMSSTKILSNSPMAKGKVSISKGETQKDVALKDYQKPRYQKL